MTDYIDRQAAIEALAGWKISPIVLDPVPSADVRENVKARWIPHPDPTLREWDICTACGTGCKRREYGKNDDGIEWMTEYGFPYCPNCGADMRGEA